MEPKEAITDLAVASADIVSGAFTHGLFPAGTVTKACINLHQSLTQKHFEKKLKKFLKPLSSSETSQEEIEKFFLKLDNKKEEVAEFMLQLLIRAETAEKADVLGILYKAAVKKEINFEQMLRLRPHLIINVKTQGGGFLMIFQQVKEGVIRTS